MNSLISRQQAIIREGQKSQEVIRLQESISNLMKEAEEHRKKEVSFFYIHFIGCNLDSEFQTVSTFIGW